MYTVKVATVLVVVLACRLAKAGFGSTAEVGDASKRSWSVFLSTFLFEMMKFDGLVDVGAMKRSASRAMRLPVGSRRALFAILPVTVTVSTIVAVSAFDTVTVLTLVIVCVVVLTTVTLAV
jgi:hypothetical protein